MASQWLGALPPPPGVEPNFDNPVDQMAQNIALHTVLLTLSTICVAIRTYTRVRIMASSLGADDCMNYRWLILDTTCANVSDSKLLSFALCKCMAQND